MSLELTKSSRKIIDTTFLGNLSPNKLEEKLAESYLGILTNDQTLFNPLTNMPSIVKDRFTEYILWLMSQPDYFYFLMKYVLNLNTWPMQALIIRELFNYRFPILLASRGFSKSFSLAVYILLRMILVPETKCIITAAGFRQAKVVFEYMETIWNKAPVLQSCFKLSKDGPTHGTDVWTFRLGNSITYALPVGPDGSKVRGYRANCLHPDTLIQTGQGLIKIKEYNIEDEDSHNDVFNIEGAPERPSAHFSTEPTEAYQLTTRNGYKLIFSHIHQLNGPNGWIAAKDLKEGDPLYLDNNDYFPKDYVKFRGTILDYNTIMFGGLLNLSSLSAEEIPWYILRSPRPIVKEFISKLLGSSSWLNRTYKCASPYKLQQLQQLLLKFNYISRVDGLKLTISGVHMDPTTRPIDYVKSVDKLDGLYTLYDFSMPTTNSFLGGSFVNHNCLIGEEFASANRQVFEEVMGGFLSVASSPIEQLKLNAFNNSLKKFKIPIPKSSKDDFIQNQLILSGTAYYQMNHFYHYFQKWQEIIKSKHDPKILDNLFDNDDDKNGINPDDYCIIRIPIELVSGGYMDMAQINRIKASTTKDVFLREYHCIFTNDSDGFFRKQLIDSCTVQDEKDPNMFVPALYGNKNSRYVFGVDPAYEGDNFAIVVLELDGHRRRVVHSWTTQASDHKQRLREGIIREQDYYHYCARKIRELMKRFPCEYIALDALGGGRAVIEAFMDSTKLEEGEQVILPTIEEGEATKETDIMPGLHIIKVIKFTSDWISQANYALKKDMEDKNIMFPFNDAVAYSLAEYYDEALGENKILYDTLEDCICEIEELKNELLTITVTETSTGREKFDTPTIKKGINQKGRLRKDRYSALLMANWVARSLEQSYIRMENPDIANLAGFCTMENPNSLFFGNNKTARKLEDLYKYL